MIQKLSEFYPSKAKPIPTLPDKVTIDMLKDAIEDISALPIGINKKNLNVFKYNFTKNLINIVTSKNIEDSIEFISNIKEVIKQLENVNIIIFDAERILQSKKVNLELNYKNFVLGIENDSNKNKQVISIIIGIDKFLNDLENGEEEFYEMLKKAEELGNYNFIIVDNAVRLKNHEYDDWYKENLSGDTGIWVGNGASDQFLITINSTSSDIINNCGQSFGYVINQGEPNLVKLVGMKERGEEYG